MLLALANLLNSLFRSGWTAVSLTFLSRPKRIFESGSRGREVVALCLPSSAPLLCGFSIE